MIYKKGALPNFNLEHRKQLRKFDDDILRYLNEQDENLDSILRNGLTHEDNLDGEFVTFTSSATPDAENTIAHTLNRVPVRFYVTSLDKGAVVYKGTTAFTKTNLYLKVNTASTAVEVFIF